MNEKILIVDDSSTVRKMIEFTLKSKGYAVADAADGQAALDLLERGERFDLVVLDINMPSLDGLTMLKTLRSSVQWARLPVFILTTEGQDSDRDQAIALGATDYMVKPFKPTELIERVAKLLQQNR